ncbi:glycoside hydrolase family 43 protein [Jiulongibacter sp. NS-SX5]|uniref:glycoside hydrolase family 43 protein n=1 Tax=Jiulongibacter sp. NS-SX5 TaxID=3463854 RepID=UPI004057F0E4
MFSSFRDNGQDGLHFAYSKDGLHYTALNKDQSFLNPTVGDDKLMRDPCIIQGPDGTFHMVWTVSWNDRGIGYAYSKDLKNWSEQRFLPVMKHESETLNTWAPEITYDNEKEEYMIYWASTIPGEFEETADGGDSEYNHRMYYTVTKDFKEFTETKLLFDPGFNCIDATIQKIDNEWIMFIKDETRYPEAAKNILIAKANKLNGPYKIISEPISKNWVEGPTYLKTSLGHTLFFDAYTRHQMEAIASDDLVNWHELSDKISFPEGTRHGTVFTVKPKVLRGLR